MSLQYQSFPILYRKYNKNISHLRLLRLTTEEFEELKKHLIFQFGISSWGGTRKLPYAFTEQGLAMLSGVLKSDIAIDVNISIMRSFVSIRRMTSSLPIPNTQMEIADLRKELLDLKSDIEDILHDQNDINEMTRAQLEAINTALAEMQAKKSNEKCNPIGYNVPSKK